MNDEVKVKSLKKALSVLECFTVERPELGITEISQIMGIYKSNVHNIVTTFEKCGFMERNPENDKYRLGLKILELSHVISSHISLRQILLPFMQELAEETREIVYLAVPNEEGDLIYLDSAVPRGNNVQARSMLGVKAPLYCTAIGKAVMAYLPEERIYKFIDKGLIRFTPDTICEREELLSELGKTKKRGYAIDNMEHEYGIKCVAIPIMDRKMKVHAGLSISGPSLRFSNEKIEEHASLLKEKFKLIQMRL